MNVKVTPQQANAGGGGGGGDTNAFPFWTSALEGGKWEKKGKLFLFIPFFFFNIEGGRGGGGGGECI